MHWARRRARNERISNANSLAESTFTGVNFKTRAKRRSFHVCMLSSSISSLSYGRFHLGYWFNWMEMITVLDSLGLRYRSKSISQLLFENWEPSYVNSSKPSVRRIETTPWLILVWSDLQLSAVKSVFLHEWSASSRWIDNGRTRSRTEFTICFVLIDTPQNISKNGSLLRKSKETPHHSLWCIARALGHAVPAEK